MGLPGAHVCKHPACGRLAQGCVIPRLPVQARANRGILYVDEVNLLDDGLVDVVLDSSASGINTVEREGVGIQHPARFIMIGSGNPQACAMWQGHGCWNPEPTTRSMCRY